MFFLCCSLGRTLTLLNGQCRTRIYCQRLICELSGLVFSRELGGNTKLKSLVLRRAKYRCEYMSLHSPLPMPSSPAKTYHPRWGWLCMFLGLYPIAFALKLFPTGDTTEYAPMWIIFLCGLAFVIAGTVILVKRHSRINTLLATLILLILGAIGVWVALFSPDEWFLGGFTGLTKEQNIVLARWMFGIGAIASFITSSYGIQQFLLSLIHPHALQPHYANGKMMPPRSVNSRPVNPRSVNPRQGHRRVRPNLLKQLLFPNLPIQKRDMRGNSKPTHPSQSRSLKRRHSRAGQSPMPPRRR